MHQPLISVKLELKYCERCGGLWLRPQGNSAVYCAPCNRAMAQLPRGAADRGRAGTLARSLSAQACSSEIVRLV